MREDALEKKTAFFQSLNLFKVDDEDDGFDGKEREAGERWRRAFFAKATAHAHVDDPGSEEPKRKMLKEVSFAPIPTVKSNAANIAKTGKGAVATDFIKKGKLKAILDDDGKGDGDGDDDVIILDKTHAREPTSHGLRSSRKRASTPLAPSRRDLNSNANDISETASAYKTKKRKKEIAIQLRPETEQIFKGLSFYYIPDDDIAPARRMRIAKAREFGVTWTRLPSAATHFIVDKHIPWRSVEAILERAHTPINSSTVVNEDYPLDCVQFRVLLPHTQKKYQVADRPCDGIGASATAISLSSSSESVNSLQLKPPPTNPERWDYVPAGDTPSRSEEPQTRAGLEPTALALDKDNTPSSKRENALVEHTIVAQGDEGYNAKGNETDQRQPLIVRRSHSNVLQQHSRSIDLDGDELSEYITMVQEYKDLPIDAEDEGDTNTIVDYTDPSTDSNEAVGSNEESNWQQRQPRRKLQSHQKKIAYEDRFACNSARPQGSNAGNPNYRTIEVLQRMTDYYSRINDHWRTTAYRKAMATLKRQDARIATEEEAFNLPNVGRRLAQKIEEIVTTNRLQRLEYAQNEPMDQTLQTFLGIYGVGIKQAQQWISQGFRTLDDLQERAKLTPNQAVGVEHYVDLNTRIPRKEVEALGDIVRKTAAEIDPQIECIIGGSYRRGAESSGDVDFIITKPGTTSTSELRPILYDLVQRLESEEFLVARLASSRSTGDGSKWYGCCVLPKVKGLNEEDYRPIWRRIDFLLVPETERGAALLYFTGNDIFNRSMRLLASNKGMRLNQRGLYKNVRRGPQREKMTQGDFVEGAEERRIFEILGVKWREPHERWC